MVLGILLAFSGLVFILQGFGMVGPHSSFMYENPQWVLGGTAVLVVGLVAVVLGVRLGK